LLFDRPSPAPTRVELQHGNLRTDGVAATLNPEQQDRLTLFERDLRALAPRAEVANLGLGADTRAEFDRRLNVHAAELKQRIARSQRTHDWQDDAMQQYA